MTHETSAFLLLRVVTLAVLVPLVSGALVGRLLRFAPEKVRRIATVIVPLLVTGLTLRSWGGSRLPMYDALLGSALVAIALGVTAWPPSTRVRRGLLLTAGSLLFGVLLLEGVARVLPAPAVGLPPLETLRWTVHGPTDVRCDLPDTDRPAASKRVVHLGDSMLNPPDVPPGTTFFERLHAAEPDVDHVNLGIPGTGPDTALRLARLSLPALKPALVVAYVFLGNDLYDIESPLPCCGDRLAIGTRADGFPVNCATPVDSGSVLGRLRTDRLPLALVALAHVSALARQATAFATRARLHGGFDRASRAPTPARIARLSELVLELHRVLVSQGSAVRIVLLPPRWSLQVPTADDPFLAARVSLVRDWTAAGLRVHDAWELLAERVAAEPGRSWFHPEPGNPHFGVEGHALMSDWLRREVLP